MIDNLPSLHPFWTVALAAALQNLKWNYLITNPAVRLFLHVLVSISLFVFPPYSLVSAFWRLVVLILRQWPSLLRVNVAGPLGKSYSKLCTLAAAFALWHLAHSYHLIVAPKNPLALGKWPPDTTTLFIVVLLSTQVNTVLSLWSRILKTRGSHDGVQQLVDSMPTKLGWKHHGMLLGLAVINAVCEEGESRGFWRSEFQLAGLDQSQSNLAQAFFFGAWHYYGIPSGKSGVILTFVYGWLMGLLQDSSDGLLLPIVAHTIADYYIFAAITKRQLQMAAAKRRRVVKE